MKTRKTESGNRDRAHVGQREQNAGADSDERELRRRLREVLYRQPADVGLLLRASRVMLRTVKGRGKEELRRKFEAVLESLGEQLLPGVEGGREGRG